MQAVVVDGTVEEIVELVKRMGARPLIAGEAQAGTPQLDHIARYVRERVKGNSDKEQLSHAYLKGVSGSGLRVEVALRENGTENDYLRGRMATLDEDRVGNVVYYRPSSMLVMLRLPKSAIDGFSYARPVDSAKSAAEFAKVKHQVNVKLVADGAVAEAIQLTKLAVEMAGEGKW